MSHEQDTDVNFYSSEPVNDEPPPLITLEGLLLNPGLTGDDGFPTLSEEEIDEILGAELEEFRAIEQQMFDEQAPPVNPPTNPPVMDTVKGRKIAKGVVWTDQHQRCDLKDANEFIRMDETLELIVRPERNQRARRENELLKDLRYVAVGENDGMTIRMPDIREKLVASVTVALRLTRLTIPHGPSNDRSVHPYPLWMKDRTVKVHHGSLLMTITNEMMQAGCIKIDKLVMEHLRQKPLAAMQQWRRHTIERFDFDEWFATNLTTAKDMIEKFQLKWSILHFQVFLIDSDQCAHATDLVCETEQLYAYEGQEIGALPSHTPRSGQPRTKRAGKSSKKVIPNKSSKNKRATRQMSTC